MKFYKIIFITMLISSTMISISSNSWLSTWMGLEMNLFSFIPLMKESMNKMSTESCMKYFITQAFASSLFLFSILMIMIINNFNFDIIYTNYFNIMMINSSLLLKMGAAPFHFWFPEIIEGMNWINCMILLTWQKIAPMMLISYTIKFISFLIFVIMSCTLIGSIMGLNQTSMRKIMVYSSINHMGWMLASFLNNEMIWIIYFMIYSIILFSFILFLNNFKIYYLKQIYLMLNKFPMLKMILMLNLFSLGGLPPFLGFFPKWMIIQYLSQNYSFLIFMMIMMTMITLFYYIRIMYSSIMILNNIVINYNIKNNNFMMISSFISLMGLIIFTINFNNF
uniref:NADH dehydrogenase subunit 2 n=1 Tax=Mastax latefasciata TaxID=2962404 RepID=UPI0021155CAD|nr:NADH dehydrogenase subunit 2 [Mastax latefasciata]UTD45006.1 NADH dehydrogenase subunit 2 [Mastax latefasciata]